MHKKLSFPLSLPLSFPFFSICDQIRRKWSYLLKKSLTENFVFFAVHVDIDAKKTLQRILQCMIDSQRRIEMKDS